MTKIYSIVGVLIGPWRILTDTKKSEYGAGMNLFGGNDGLWPGAAGWEGGRGAGQAGRPAQTGRDPAPAPGAEPLGSEMQ